MVTLNSGYIFSYSTYDDFCERLLAAELLVDHDFIFFDTTDRGSQQFLLNLD
ncbi:hypothetical protein [Chryseobacterium sp. SIMBA_028]|uniref:hypothetical protein n=1 Tax=Chryseobacterium sp. SIMBA_028 TaxID=3085771 RepID=UPI00397B5CDA